MYWLYNLPQNTSNAIIVHIEEDNLTINEKQFFLSDITSRNDFTKYCKFVFPFKQLSPESQRTIEDSYGGKHFYPLVINTFDILGFTHNTKLNSEEFGSTQLYPIVVSLLFYPHSTNFKNALLSIIRPSDPNTPFSVTTKDSKGNIVDYIPDKILTDMKTRAKPKCTLTSIKNENNPLKSQTITFQYRDVDSVKHPINFKAKVKASAGYITHREINVVDGEATFTWIPLGLASGEKAEIQIEIGRYTDICSLIVEG